MSLPAILGGQQALGLIHNRLPISSLNGRTVEATHACESWSGWGIGFVAREGRQMTGPGLAIASLLVCLISILLLAAAMEPPKPDPVKPEPGYWEPRR